jgi:hypothetical protein
VYELAEQAAYMEPTSEGSLQDVPFLQASPTLEYQHQVVVEEESPNEVPLDNLSSLSPHNKK